MQTVELDYGVPLALEQLESIAAGAPLALAPGHWGAVEACRAFLERLISERRRIYGVTTGYGPLAGTYVDTGASAELQRNLVYHLSAGTGPLLSRCQVRAIMAARAVAVAQGHSAIRPQALSLLLACLAEDIVPCIPSLGTVGASGDLTPLAHMTLALMGEGRVEHRGRLRPAAEALAEHGLEPLDPTGKDALALVNGTSAMTAIAGLNAVAAGRALRLSAALTVLYGELLQGRLEAYRPGLSVVRPHPGQRWAQQALLALATGSRRWRSEPQPPPPLPVDLAPGQARLNQPLPQDPYSLRCAPQLLGAVADVLLQHNEVVTRELNAVTDNPVFLPAEGEVLHGGNFFGQHVAFAADGLNNAVITLAIHSERRIARITDSAQNNGLPPFLRGNDSGLHSGFMGAQVTATALVAELRAHATPASIQSIPTNANNQDVVTMGTIAARRCAESLQRLQELLAIEALILVQGLELAGDEGFAPGSLQLAAWVRQHCRPLAGDRPLTDDIARLAHVAGALDLCWADLPSWPPTA